MGEFAALMNVRKRWQREEEEAVRREKQERIEEFASFDEFCEDVESTAQRRSGTAIATPKVVRLRRSGSSKRLKELAEKERA